MPTPFDNYHSWSFSKNVSSFLRPVIDEFVQLFDQGIVLSDGSIVRAVTDILAIDYEAQSKVLCMKEQGAIQGCHLCTIQRQYVHNLRQVVYLNNRGYIRPLSHHLRSATVYFKSNPEDLDIPKPRNHEDIIAQGRECLSIRQRIREGIMTERGLREYQKKTGVNVLIGSSWCATWFTWECTSRFYALTAECLGTFVLVPHGRNCQIWGPRFTRRT